MCGTGIAHGAVRRSVLGQRMAIARTVLGQLMAIARTFSTDVLYWDSVRELVPGLEEGLRELPLPQIHLHVPISVPYRTASPALSRYCIEPCHVPYLSTVFQPARATPPRCTPVHTRRRIGGGCTESPSMSDLVAA
eukprot:5457-Rhodomonas_salina.6